MSKDYPAHSTSDTSLLRSRCCVSVFKPSSTLPRTQLHITMCHLPRELGWGWGTRVSSFSIHRAVSALNSKKLMWINDTKGIDSVWWSSHKPDPPLWNIWERRQPFSVIAQLVSALCAHWSCLRATDCKEKRSYINTHVVFSVSFIQVHWKGQDFTQETLNDNIWEKPADFVRHSWPKVSSEIPREVKAY